MGKLRQGLDETHWPCGEKQRTMIFGAWNIGLFLIFLCFYLSVERGKNRSQNNLQSYIFHISEAKHSSLFAKLCLLVGPDISVALTLCHWIFSPQLLFALAIHLHPGLWHHFMGSQALLTQSCIQTSSEKDHAVVLGLTTAGGKGKKTKQTGLISLCIFVITSLQVLLGCCGLKRLWIGALQNSEGKAFRLSLETHINNINTTQVERGQTRQRH